jgi:hypothetical protein
MPPKEIYLTTFTYIMPVHNHIVILVKYRVLLLWVGVRVIQIQHEVFLNHLAMDQLKAILLGVLLVWEDARGQVLG